MAYFKLLIADDEENIRNGLKYILDWEKFGYKICGEASSGNDAIEQINNLNPDLVIQDVKMPGASGIDVIFKVKSECEKNNKIFPSFIILSGFSDFDYAKEALNLGAKAYLLKPVDEDELAEKVKKITEEIKNSKKINSALKNNKIFETKDILEKMIQSSKIPTEIDFTNLSFFENPEESNYQVVICNFDYCENYNIISLKKAIENYFSFFKTFYLNLGNKIIIIIKTSNINAVKNSVLRTSKLQIGRTFITVGKNCKGLQGIIDSYKNAKENEKYLFFYSELPYISDGQINFETKEFNKKEYDDLIDNVIFCIETYNKNQLEKDKEIFKQKTFNINESEKNIKKIFIYFLIEIHYRLEKKYPEREVSDGETFDVVKKLLEYNNFDEIFNCFSKVLNDFLENFNFNTADSVIVKVLAYVKTNYASDLKLETLGELFNCNSAYLGKKFKKYTGLQFNVYLDKLRMDIAKDKLINSDLKIYQISKLVGFSNTDYFFMKFKKNTGLTPKEYKKKVEDEKNH